jgi:hypothetical protein
MLGGRQGRGVLERIGRHLAVAARPEESPSPLLGGAAERLKAGDLRRTEALLDIHDRTLQAAGGTPADDRWGRSWILRLRLAARRGDDEAVASWAHRVKGAVQAHNWPEIIIALTHEQARQSARTGRLEEAWSQLLPGRVGGAGPGRQGPPGAMRAGAGGGRGGPRAARAGRWTQFDGHLEAARQLVAATGYADEDVAWSARLAGQIASELQERDRARACYTLALQLIGRHSIGSWHHVYDPESEEITDSEHVAAVDALLGSPQAKVA